MPEPQTLAGAFGCHNFDGLSPQLNHDTQQSDMCWTGPRRYSLAVYRSTKTQGKGIYYRNVIYTGPDRMFRPDPAQGLAGSL